MRALNSSLPRFTLQHCKLFARLPEKNSRFGGEKGNLIKTKQTRPKSKAKNTPSSTHKEDNKTKHLEMRKQ